MNEKDKEYQASLKSLETENIIDRKFYRPIGFYFAKLLSRTRVTPNMVTILSIFVGLGGGLCFVHTPYDLRWTVAGILCMIVANIMDCIDGQLARLTGIKSEIGRILDGIAGDIWFACIYICFIIRLTAEYPDALGPMTTGILIAVGLLSGISHLVQAAVTDYYKTLHLFFISPEKGKEFERSSSIRRRVKVMPRGANRFFSSLYYYYTLIQERATPRLQRLLDQLEADYPQNTIPETLRQDLRRDSRRIMNIVDFLTFNGRTIPLFLIVLSGHVWLYFVFEILILNIVLILGIRRHEAMCRQHLKERR